MYSRQRRAESDITFAEKKDKGASFVMVMNYPTIAEVVKADREHVFRWWEMLPRPENEREKRIYELIFRKFRCLGGSVLKQDAEARLSNAPSFMSSRKIPIPIPFTSPHPKRFAQS